MLRPWWIGMLLFALLVAAVFAWLGQWQLGRAIDTNPPPPGATEQVQPIADVTAPGEYLPEPLVGQKVAVAGAFVPGDFLIVSSRFNDGQEGYWVTGQLRVDPAAAGGVEPASLAVAIGWAATREAADAAASALDDAAGADVELTGRLISDEGPVRPGTGAPATEMTRMSPAALLGRWHDAAGLNVYRPYLVADGLVADGLGADELVADGLVAIDSPAPTEGSNVNWLNIFYAVEWAIFAGFAFYMWYRLAKDAWEKEVEALEESSAEGGAPGD
ncbi:MAG: SURF1 family protein [Microbacterium sp.]|uniref:SURF1 family protein n=1 Tax=Microbacterium sp. TaxID=51671 RepID=UPI001AC6F882|nr:SURF1 family cytochrome oxidase biogenesis protein [Microbacterium sp.]MBN9178564.1 SURF1 family protein [Microbacterium sp.]